MAKKAWLLSLLIVFVISLGVFTLKGFAKEKTYKDTKSLSVISEKISEILKNQKAIIAQLKDIREQQDIIRIRASRK